MALVGADASRKCRHLGCGDDGLDIGTSSGHQEATLGREQAGFERHPGKEVVSRVGALIKEVPFRRHEDGLWRVDPLPLKVRVLAGEGDPETGVPRFLSDFDSLDQECDRSGTPCATRDAARAFLFLRYGRPLRRLHQFGVGVPMLGPGPKDWLLQRPTAEGTLGVPFARPGAGGSPATDSLIRGEMDRRREGWDFSGDRGPPGREAAQAPLVWDVFTSRSIAPGKSPGPESLPELLRRLGASLAPPLQRRRGADGEFLPESPGFLAAIGPKTVSDFPSDFQTVPGSRLQRRKAFRKERLDKTEA